MSERATPDTGELMRSLLKDSLEHRAMTMAAHAMKLQRERDEALEALAHMQWCQSCAEGSWEDCDGGRAALAILAKAKP